MAAVKSLNSLREAGQRWQAAAGELEQAAQERDRLIVEATTAGASRRQVAAAAGVTPGRVQQILDRIKTTV
jgi:hypothetical protein